MDPNTNQSNNQQIPSQQQAVPMPQNPVETVHQQEVQYQNPNIKKGNKTVLVLIVLLVLVIGLTSYLIFVNMNANKPPKSPTSDVQVIPPTSTPMPTPSPAEDDLSVEDPEVDIKALDDAAATL